MKGEELKEKIRLSGRRFNEVADAMGITPQALQKIFGSDDVKTSTIERVAKVLGKPVTYFYGDGSIMATDNAVVRDSNNNNETRGIIVLSAQLSIKDKQIDRLLGIIENLNK